MAASCRVYIGGLHSDTKLRDVERFFKRYKRRFDVLLKERFGFIVSFRNKNHEVERGF